jgi:hypothetical protein
LISSISISEKTRTIDLPKLVWLPILPTYNLYSLQLLVDYLTQEPLMDSKRLNAWITIHRMILAEQHLTAEGKLLLFSEIATLHYQLK